MTTKTPPKSRILEAVYETASDLKRLEDLRCAIAAGLASGPSTPADEVFDRLEAKYTAMARDDFAP